MKKKYKSKKQMHAEKLANSKKLIKKANLIPDHFESAPLLRSYVAKDNSCFNFICKKVKDLTVDELEWVFDLMERNMKNMYENCSWGWKPKAKQEELTEDSAWYLIGSFQDKPVGFSHFRFDLDDQIEVLYCYELQLEESERRKGLGCFMIKILEAFAAQNKMQKVVLTVLKNNPMALAFFPKQGYKLDETNPPPSQGVDYIILSKSISPLVKKLEEK